MTFTPRPRRRAQYTQEDDIPLEKLRACLRTVAAATTANPTYLPIFIRLENEIAKRQQHTSALARARQLAQGIEVTHEHV